MCCQFHWGGSFVEFKNEVLDMCTYMKGRQETPWVVGLTTLQADAVFRCYNCKFQSQSRWFCPYTAVHPPTIK